MGRATVSVVVGLSLDGATLYWSLARSSSATDGSTNRLLLPWSVLLIIVVVIVVIVVVIVVIVVVVVIVLWFRLLLATAFFALDNVDGCLLYTSPSPRD